MNWDFRNGASGLTLAGTVVIVVCVLVELVSLCLD